MHKKEEARVLSLRTMFRTFKRVELVSKQGRQSKAVIDAQNR